ncbi:MAG: glycosyltransferase family 4 protein [Phycisphaerae bacterium]|nr:glycosyltransferase family 4 protein [Phycisphaerae bacterium]
MHILYLHQHFAIPAGSTGTRSYEFARRWIKAGHMVTVITGRCDVGGLDYSKKTQSIDGIKVIIAGGHYSNKQSFLRRIFTFISFVIMSIIVGCKQKNVDIIYATSTPLTVGVPAVVIKWLKRIPFVFEVRDQWPQVPIALGIIKNKILIKILLCLEKIIYKNASSIVALSPGMAEGIKKVFPDKTKQIIVVPNCSDTELFHSDIDGSVIRQKYGWDKKVVFLHAGAMGKVNSLNFIIDAAEKLKENKDILFVLLGQGNQKLSLEKRLTELNLDNVQILPPVAKRKLPEFFAAADVGTVIIGNYPIIEHNSANKFFDTLSAGKPVLLNYSGWQREIIESQNAGLGCKLCDLDEFVEKVLFLAKNRENLNQMGKNARKLAEEKFSRDKSAGRVLRSLEKAVQIK